MKRILSVALLILLLLCGCGRSLEPSVTEKDELEVYKNSATSGVWLSFTEINSMLLSENGFENELKTVVENISSLNIGNVYIHIRSYCDSLYKSQYFPLVKSAENYSGDAFELMLDAFHEKGIRVHAWINPYRVLTSSSDIEALSSESPAYKWLKDDNPQNDTNVLFHNGIYLNPASLEVNELIINGIREVIESYEIDGIHFDDYFYPTTDSEFDTQSYEAYCNTAAKPMSLYDWRRENVNNLINGCNSAIKFRNKDIEFSISPTASIDKNYNEYFADVEFWVKEGMVDTIIPQLYFGFDYPLEEFQFEALLEAWEGLMRANDEVLLLIGLAPYKIGTDTEADKEEWGRYDDIIARQAKACFESGRTSGFVLFSYTGVFSAEELNTKQRDNLNEFILTYK